MKYFVTKNDTDPPVTILKSKLEAYLYQKNETGGSDWKDKTEWICGFMWKDWDKNIYQIIDASGHVLRYDLNEFERLLKKKEEKQNG